MKTVLLALVASLAWSQLPETKSHLEAPVKLKSGAVVSATVVLEVPEGYHAYAIPALHDEVTLLVSPVDGAKYKLVKIAYPKGTMTKYPAFGDEQLNAYEGIVKIPVQVKLPKDAKGKYTLKLNLRSQFCSNTEGQCFPPVTQTLSASFTITAK